MPPPKNRPGRPPESARRERRDAALDAALAEIVEHGYEKMTMSAVARRAGSSKESLYAWFGSKEGLVAAVIERQSAATNAAVRAALDAEDLDARSGLVTIASGLLHLLLGDASLAINRAAMTSPSLAEVLLRHGRHTTGPIVEQYLASLPTSAGVPLDDPVDAFSLLYGLVVQDAQIRSLLGEPAPPPEELDRRAAVAVDRFLLLIAGGGASDTGHVEPTRG